MREDRIFQMRDDEKKRVIALYRQLQFVRTRLEALELVLTNPWNCFKAVFSPQWLWSRVDFLQMALLQKHDAEVRESAERLKEEKAKPSLIVPSNGFKKLIAVTVAFLFSGCVSRKFHDASIKALSAECHAAFIEKRIENDLLKRELSDKTKRLESFNQVDEAGILRALKAYEQKEEPKSTGKESWQK